MLSRPRVGSCALSRTPRYDTFRSFSTSQCTQSAHEMATFTNPTEVVVEPGDVLYMPPGVLHHVRSLDCAFSFNVDWHTKASALRGALAFARGMPAKNVYYNMIIAFGLWSGVSAKRLLPYYRPYLNYVS
nr:MULTISPECIES: cupin domain-containing protein [Methylosinus]